MPLPPPNRPVPAMDPAPLQRNEDETDQEYMARATAAQNVLYTANRAAGAALLGNTAQLLAVAQRKSILPPHGQVSDAQGADATSTYNNTDFENLEFNQGAKQVLNAALVEGTVDKNLGGTVGNLVMELSVQAKANFVPIYFLPWRSRCIYQMTIPAMGQAPHGVPDPDVFFTAAINGCSVFFKDGPGAGEVTVYHAGIDSMQHGDLGVRNSGRFWRDLLYEKEAGLAGQMKGHKTFGEVKASQYINKRGQDRTLSSKWQNVTDDSKAYQSWLKNQYTDVLKVRQVEPWGCVFGLRDAHGAWTFYLQENAKIVYSYLKKKTGKALTAAKLPGVSKFEVESMSFTVDRPVTLQQVFPGRAHVQISGQVDLS